MKKALSFVLVIVMLFGACLSLASCGESSDVPAGMQLVRGSDELGYYFYGPAGWVVANNENVACTYVSKLNNTTFTFAEAELPTVTLEEYVESELKRFPSDFELVLEQGLKEEAFGNAEKAYRIIYYYTVGEYKYKTYQMFVINDNRFFIYTYTASRAMRDEEKSYYDYYLEISAKVVEAFKFVEKKASSGEEIKPEYKTDSDGYRLLSDRSVCFFDLWCAPEYSLDFATSIVSVTDTEGRNINVSEATFSGAPTTEGYWKYRLDQLGLVAEIKNTGKPFGVDLGAGLDCAAIEYEYTLGGKDYKVYQALVSNGFRVFVFTYTAESDRYESGLDIARKILDKAVF